MKKKGLKAEGKLDKFGRTNENTPADWKANYTDYGAAAGEVALPHTTEIPATENPTPKTVTEPVDVEMKLEATKEEAAPSEKKSKKRKTEDGPEETKEERKARKAAKKAKKEAKGT